MARTELFILKTKEIDDDLYLFFRYKIHDDNDAITEFGVKYRKYEDDMEISDNGVKKDSVGAYTLDGDGNKVYQQLDVYVLDEMFYDRTKTNYTFVTKKGSDDPESHNVEFTDFDKDGKYTLDNDDITVNIDLANKLLSWTPKNGDTGIIEIGISLDALYFVNEDMNQQQMLNHQFEVINQAKGLVLQDKVQEAIDDIDRDYNALNTKLDDKTNEIKNNDNSNKDSIISNDNNNKNTLIQKIDDDKDDIENHIDNFITEFTTLDGSDGAYLKDGTKIKLSNFKDIIWTIDKSFHFTNDRGIVKIAYKIYSTSTDSEGNEFRRNMIIDQNLVSEVVE